MRQAAGFGGGKLRVTGAGELVRLQQVFGGRRGRQQDCQGEREGEGAAAHARFLWIKRRRPARAPRRRGRGFRSRTRSEEHTSELQSLMRISYAVFCLKKKKKRRHNRDKV